MLKKGTFSGDLIRYGVVGGIAFIVDFCGLIILKEHLAIHHLIAAAISFTAGLIVNYYLSISWVFIHRKVKKISHEIAIFATIGVLGLLINEIIIFLGTDMLKIHYLYSKIIATIVVFFWNFLARRTSLFKTNA